MVSYAQTALRHYELLSGHLENIKGYEGYAGLAESLEQTAIAENMTSGHPSGTPDAIIEQTRALAEAFGTSEITFVFRYGGMPLGKAQKSMDLFARKVLPALHDMPLLRKRAGSNPFSSRIRLIVLRPRSRFATKRLRAPPAAISWPRLWSAPRIRV
jgi:hypothetical protein